MRWRGERREKSGPTESAKCIDERPVSDATRPPRMSTHSPAPRPAPRKEKSALERSVYTVSAAVTEAVSPTASSTTRPRPRCWKRAHVTATPHARLTVKPRVR